MSKTKTDSKKDSNINLDVTSHLGICAKVCKKYYFILPADVRSYYDLDDMISDVVLHVFKKSALYDASKSKESTWVWHVADNKCKSILGHHTTKQYTAMKTVELTPEMSKRLHVSPRREEEAKNAVERLIQYGSDEVRDFLDKIFNSKCHAIRSVPVYELTSLATLYAVSLPDLLIVLQCFVD